MAVNKVVCTGVGTILDLQSDTITSDMLFSGYTAHAASGEVINGSLDILSMTWNDLAVSAYNPASSSSPVDTMVRQVNKVQLGNRVLIDLTSDNVYSKAVIRGYQFHEKSGHRSAGTLALSEMTWNDYEDILSHSN